MSQSYSGQDLRGKSFRGQDLTGADFSHADLRGADFSNAILARANFCHIKAGQRYYWVTLLLSISSLLALLAGYIIAYAGALVGSLMVKANAQPAGLWSGIAALILIAIFSVVAVRKGLGTALGTFCVVVALAVVIVAAAGEADAIAAAIVQSVAIAGTIVGVILGATAISATWMLFRYAGYVAVCMALVGCLPGALEGVRGLSVETDYTSLALAVSGAVAVTLIGLSVYIGWRVVTGDRHYFVIPLIATTLASLGGTRFRGANLTDADFTEADLKSVDFRGAILKRTCWLRSVCVERSRLHGTYLEIPRVRQLVTTKSAQGQVYDHLDLRGLNLEGANLQGASFIGTDFNESNLKRAILVGAKLVKAQLYQTNLEGACLTGAYIQDWGISTETNLNNIKCEYIFMHLPTEEDPDPSRKPDSRQEKFQDGDFTDFIAPIIKTLGLYQSQNVDTRKIASRFKTLDLFHHEGIDPSAAAVTIQQVAEKYPEAQLEVIALEGRGNEKIRLQAKVTDAVDRSKLSEEYFEAYERIRSLSYSDIQKLLIGVEEKDNHIRLLQQLLENALQQPKFYVETYQNQGEFVMTQDQEVVMGDKYENKGQAGAMGPNAHVHDVTFTQLVGQLDKSVDYAQLADELSKLRQAMKAEATEVEHDIAVSEIAKAEQAVKAKDSSKVVEHLQTAGKWALDVATKIGVPIAVEVLKQATGIGKV